MTGEDPTRAAAEILRFEAKDRPLKRDVRRLGAMLGRMLKEIGSAGLYERVEAARVAALAWRRGDSEQPLIEITRGLGADEALELGRAFSSWFSLVNLAERVHRERRLASYAVIGQPRPASLAPVLHKLKARGLDLYALERLWQGLSIEPVFTAHPTEALRRTMLQKELAMGQALDERREDVAAPGREQARALRRVREALYASWQTDEHLTLRPTVADEREQTLFYLSEILWQALPQLAREFKGALREVYGPAAERLVERWPIRFASWVGGDMDGNPNVDGTTIRATLERHGELAVTRLIAEVRELFQALSQSRSRVGFSPAFEARLKALEQDLPGAFAAIPERYRDMPYRQYLWLVNDRLRATLERRATAYRDSEELARDLALIGDSLCAHGGAHAGLERLEDTLVRIRAFGLRLATLDVRQDALVHRELLGPLLGVADFAALAGAERTRRIGAALGADPLEREPAPADPEARRTLDVFRAIGEVRGRFGERAIGLFVISMTQGPDDALAVLYLARRAGLVEQGGVPLDVTPLFETVDDLAAAPQTLEALLAEVHYREHLRRRGDLQWVMLGYSDSNKTAGMVPSRIALQQAQARLVRIAETAGVELAFFHGRGGSTSRGGSKPRAAVLSSQANSLRGRLRVTEQGEIIRAKFGSEGLARRTLEVLLAATLERTALDSLGHGHRDAETPLLAELASDARAAFDRLVREDPRFLPFFRSATPIDGIERLALGSRPARRREQKSVEDLRAIPWVFAWTQCRLVLPGWYGLGQALAAAEARHGLSALRNLLAQSPTFAGLLRDAEMVLAKADLGVARHYASLAGPAEAGLFEALEAEFQATVQRVLAVLEADQLLAQDPGLARAIRLRNPYIDPISHLQVDLLRRWRASDRQDAALERALFATIHGIARGLLNTG